MPLVKRDKFTLQDYIDKRLLRFYDGVDDNDIVPTWSYKWLDNNHEWAISFLIVPDAVQDPNARIIATSQGASRRGVDIRLNAGLQLSLLFYTGSTTTISFSSNLKAGVPVFVTITFTQSEIRLYYNGFLAETIAHTLPSFAKDDDRLSFSIGGAVENLRFFKGYIGCVRIFSIAPTLKQIQEQHDNIGYISPELAKYCIYEQSYEEDIESSFWQFTTDSTPNLSPVIVGSDGAVVIENQSDYLFTDGNFWGINDPLLDGSDRNIKVFIPNFRDVSQLNFNFNPWAKGDIDFSVFSDNVDFLFQNNQISSFDWREGQIVREFNNLQGLNNAIFNFDKVIFNNSTLQYPGGGYSNPVIFSTAYGLNTLLTSVIRGNQGGNIDLNLTNVQLTGGTHSISVNCGTGTYLFSNLNNTATSLGISGNGTFIVNLDLTNVVVPIVESNFCPNVTGILTFSNTPNSLTSYTSIQCGFDTFVFQETYVDSNTILIQIHAHGLSTAQVDALYIAIHGAWVAGGSQSLSGCTISTDATVGGGAFGANALPSAASQLQRDALGDATGSIGAGAIIEI